MAIRKWDGPAWSTLTAMAPAQQESSSFCEKMENQMKATTSVVSLIVLEVSLVACTTSPRGSDKNSDTDSGDNSCQITEDICPDNPDYTGTFEDIWGDQNAGALDNPANCMQRATDYYNWCGGASLMDGHTTTATYYSDGDVVQSVTVGGSQVPGWVPCAVEGETCTLPSSPVQVMYGWTPDPGGYKVTETFSDSSILCNADTFGGNPNPVGWEPNNCWYWGMVTAAQQDPSMIGMGPMINLPVTATAFPGSGLQRVQPTTLVADPAGAGAFRDACGFSHFLFDDPIVTPGQPGMSHLHLFFGNTGTDTNSTSASLQTSGNSTCGGGTLNRSGYWVPAMIDNSTHDPVRSTGNNVYYKTEYPIPSTPINAVPPGLVMIAGSAANTQPGVNPVRYICISPTSNPGWQATIPTTCPVGSELIMEVTFPNCWDGVNLDSPDHKSHMAYYDYQDSSCPADHPVLIPTVSYNIHYDMPYDNATANWQLSSDNYDVSGGNAGNSGHGDYMYGWDTPTMQTFVQYCERDPHDCHDYLLGNGTTLY